MSRRSRALGRVRAKKDWGDVAKDRREAVLKPIDEAAERLIVALVVEAMIQREGSEYGRGGVVLLKVKKVERISAVAESKS